MADEVELQRAGLCHAKVRGREGGAGHREVECCCLRWIEAETEQQTAIPPRPGGWDFGPCSGSRNDLARRCRSKFVFPVVSKKQAKKSAKVGLPFQWRNATSSWLRRGDSMILQMD